MKNRFVIDLAEQIRLVKRPLTQLALGDLRHADDGESPRQVPAKLGFDGEAVNRRPRLGFIIEQRELDRQIIATALNKRVDSRRKGIQRFLNGTRKAGPLGGRDPVEADGPSGRVEFRSVGTDDFRKPTKPFASQPVELKQPVFGHRKAETKKQIAISFGKDVRNTVCISPDRNVTGHSGRDLSFTGDRTLLNLLLPPGIKFRARNPVCLADLFNGLALSQQSESFLIRHSCLPLR